MLPGVSIINGGLRLYEENLVTSVDLTGIIKINWLRVQRMPSMMSLVAPDLVEVARYIRIDRNDVLTVVDMPEVRVVGEYISMNNRSLAAISFPNLVSIGDVLQAYKCPLLNLIHMPELQTVGSRIVLQYDVSDSVVVVEQVRFHKLSFQYK